MKKLIISIFIVMFSFVLSEVIVRYFEAYAWIICLVLFIAIILLVKTSNKKNTIYFTKFKPEAKIPTKRDEDMGYDIYPCFDEELITIMPHTTKMIPTGIGSVFDKSWGIILKERGSTGTKGIEQRCGVIDSGFRGEWMVPITNGTNKEMVISKNVDTVKENSDVILYPYDKAICQAIVLPSPALKIKEVTNDQYETFNSERGTGKLGSSGK